MTWHRNDTRFGFERHIRGATAVIMVGLIGWVGKTVNDLQTGVAAMQVDIRNLGERVAELRVGEPDLYRRSDAARDMQHLLTRISEFVESVRDVRHRVDAIERQQP